MNIIKQYLFCKKNPSPPWIDLQRRFFLEVERIFVEKCAMESAVTQSILSQFLHISPTFIEDISTIFGRTKKPYLQKRSSLQIFIGHKKGEKVKLAPQQYGVAAEKHYYFVHAYNCIYECQYCYLQGYFSSPDLVFFVNHDEIIQAMREVLLESVGVPIWFHAGEFSDSLAMSWITQEWKYYWPMFAEYPQTFLELRTKSAHTKSIENLDPLPNVIVSYSVSPQSQIEAFEGGTASLQGRIAAIARLQKKGFVTAIHLDPIIDDGNILQTYKECFARISEQIDVTKLRYISLGVVRFTSQVYREFQKNYPDSGLHGQSFVNSSDGKKKYRQAHRKQIFDTVEMLLQQVGVTKQQIYLCME